jgi:hypothetical protein
MHSQVSIPKLSTLRTVSCAVLISLSAIAMSGCGGGDSSASAQSTSGTTTAQTAANTGGTVAPVTSPDPGPVANQKPVIGGSVITAVSAGNAYHFIPTASDADGDTLAFSIQNKPAWATFASSTGALSGTPAAADIGTYANITITVSDGKASTALGPFSIAVNAISDGQATLSWTAPTQNADGSVLTNLAGYKIHYGTDPTALSKTINVSNASITTYLVEDLSPTTWYFAITSVNAAGVESDYSNVANKAI